MSISFKNYTVVRIRINLLFYYLFHVGFLKQFATKALILYKQKICRKPIFLLGTFNYLIEGNALLLARYASKRKDIQFYIISHKDFLYDLKKQKINGVERNSFLEKFLLKNADAVFTVGNMKSDFSSEPVSSATRIMLWHGIPLKAVGLKNLPIPDPAGYYDYIIATSPFTSKMMSDAFATSNSKMIMTGQPKTDALFNVLERKMILEKITDIAAKKVISYLPTWRHDFSKEYGGDFARNSKPITDAIISLNCNLDFLDLLEKYNAIFIVKLHSWDEVKKINVPLHKRIISIDPDLVLTEDLMVISDIVVSDYSGAVIDWLILQKPLICYTFDYQEYWSNRGSPSFDYKEVFKDLMVYNEIELVSAIRNYFVNPQINKSEIAEISGLLHSYKDNSACVRIINKILEAVKAKK